MSLRSEFNAVSFILKKPKPIVSKENPQQTRKQHVRCTLQVNKNVT